MEEGRTSVGKDSEIYGRCMVTKSLQTETRTIEVTLSLGHRLTDEP